MPVGQLDFSDAEEHGRRVRAVRRTGSAPAARRRGRSHDRRDDHADGAPGRSAQRQRGRSATRRRPRPLSVAGVPSRVMSSVAQYTDTRKPCPYCSRRFAPGARERHVDVCKNVVNRPSPVLARGATRHLSGTGATGDDGGDFRSGFNATMPATAAPHADAARSGAYSMPRARSRSSPRFTAAFTRAKSRGGASASRLGSRAFISDAPRLLA